MSSSTESSDFDAEGNTSEEMEEYIDVKRITEDNEEPVPEESEPVPEESEPIPEKSITEESEPVPEKSESIPEKSDPEKSEPVPEESEPVPEISESVPEKSVPEESEPIAEKSEPIAEKPDSIPEESEPVPEKSVPVPETLLKETVKDSEEYFGMNIKPLSSFGTFDISPETRAIKWIRDNTSGSVHQDIPTISMLYNQNINLSKEASEFVAQSPKLQEEARWEFLKAAFYKMHPREIRLQAYKTLSKLSVLEASRVIAMKTARSEQEVLLKPINSGNCDEKVAERLNEEILVMSEVAEKFITEKTMDLEKHRDVFNKYHSFRKFTSGHYKENDSRAWKRDIQSYQNISRDLIEAQLFLFQLKHAKARYEPRTEWIHVKTLVSLTDPEDENSLCYQVYKLLRPQKIEKIETFEGKIESVEIQMDRFEFKLQNQGTGRLKTSNPYIIMNNSLFVIFWYPIKLSVQKYAPLFYMIAFRVYVRGKLFQARLF